MKSGGPMEEFLPGLNSGTDRLACNDTPKEIPVASEAGSTDSAITSLDGRTYE